MLKLNILLIIIITVLFSGCSINDKAKFNDIDLIKTDDYYHLDGDKIYAFNKNFIPIGGTGGKSDWFYLNYADFKTFLVLGGGYAKDKNAAYLYSHISELKKIKDIDYESFIYIGKQFAKDNNKVFFRDRIISDADPFSFSLIDGPNDFFTKDKNYVYLYDKKIDGLNPESFEILSWTEARDKNHEYKVDMNKGTVTINN